jgi:MYXO-CTERM domain-containing protein
MFLIKPGIYTDGAGLGLLAVVAAAQLIERRRLAEARP